MQTLQYFGANEMRALSYLNISYDFKRDFVVMSNRPYKLLAIQIAVEIAAKIAAKNRQCKLKGPLRGLVAFE